MGAPVPVSGSGYQITDPQGARNCGVRAAAPTPAQFVSEMKGKVAESESVSLKFRYPLVH